MFYTDRQAGGRYTNLFEALVDFIENAPLVEHLTAISMLVVVGDVVAKLSRQLAINHILFHLLELHHTHIQTHRSLSKSFLLGPFLSTVIRSIAVT